MTTMSMTDGGLETSLIFERGIELPAFAAFPLLESDSGRTEIAHYFRPYFDEANTRGLPFVIDTPTWRANPDWGSELGYSATALADANKISVDFVRHLAKDLAHTSVNGVIGPRGDGYFLSDLMSADEAAEYHAVQLGVLAGAGVDRVSALTLTYVDEAIGIVRAAADRGIDVVISFTVETDGRLPDGTSLADAIEQVDAGTNRYTRFFMVNCAHPSHIARDMNADQAARVGGIRVNGSALSHAELDQADELQADAPVALGRAHAELHSLFPQVELLGGCCGTNVHHVAAIVDRW